MNDLDRQARRFLTTKRHEQLQAAQLVAVQLLCGLDLPTVVAAGRESRDKALRRLERLIERERLRGQARHWSYDLNRHIALKQAADRLRATLDDRSNAGFPHTVSAHEKRRPKAPSMM